MTDQVQNDVQSQDTQPWFDATHKDYVANKGWQNPNDVLTSYVNLEKVFGADKAGRTVVLPSDNATPDELNTFYSKLGRPEKPDMYDLPVPQGEDPAFSKVASQWFHDVGLPSKAAKELAGKWNNYVAMSKEAMENAFNEKAAADLEALKKDWGADYDKNTELGRRAAREFGISAEKMEAIERVWGTKDLMNFFHSIGSKLGEHTTLPSGQSGDFGMTKEQAQAKVTALQNDKEFRAKLIAGDIKAKEEWDRVNRLAVGI